MKLSIRSKVLENLKKILNMESIILCFRIGRITRDGFIPDINYWEKKNIQSCLENLGTATVSKSFQFKELCRIGTIMDHGVVLGQLIETSEGLKPSYYYDINDPRCSVGMIGSYIQIELPCEIRDLKTLFNPVKLIYGLLKKPVLLIESQIVNSYPPTPTPVRVHECPCEGLDKWVIAPAFGEWATLCFYSSITCLIINKRSYRINIHSKYSQKEKSIFHGYWNDNQFTICLPVMIHGQDITKHRLSHRLALSKRSIIGISYCRVTKIFASNNLNIVRRYGTIVYLPRKSNNKLLPICYHSVQNISLFFNVVRRFHGDFSFFELVDKEGIFLGSKDYPYNSPISLCREDRDLIDNFPPSAIIEFRWENDNLVPYRCSRRISLPSTNKSEWNLLHRTKGLFKNTEATPKAQMMANQRNPLKMLPVNKSVVFYSPLEGDDVLVRTGTIGEGSCLFHALLHAYSKDYATMDRKSRMKFVIRLRASMAGKVNVESWEEMGEGVISKVPYQENVREILENFYRFVNEEGGKVKGRSSRRVLKKLIDSNNELNDVYRVLSELVPYKVLTTTCLPRGYDRTQDDKIDQTNIAVCEEVTTHLCSLKEMKQLDDKKAKYIVKKMNDLMLMVLKEAKDSAYRSYVKGLERVSESVDTYTIEFISNRFDRDIYFLDGTSKLPYNTCPTSVNLKGRKSMIILWIGGNHYEIVGRLLPGNRIQREFAADDELINRMRTFLTQPEKIKELYPDFVKYLPRCYRSKSPLRRNINSHTTSSEGEDSISDQYYDSSDHSDSPSESD